MNFLSYVPKMRSHGRNHGLGISSPKFQCQPCPSLSFWLETCPVCALFILCLDNDTPVMRSTKIAAPLNCWMHFCICVDLTPLSIDLILNSLLILLGPIPLLPSQYCCLKTCSCSPTPFIHTISSTILISLQDFLSSCIVVRSSLAAPLLLVLLIKGFGEGVALVSKDRKEVLYEVKLF